MNNSFIRTSLQIAHCINQSFMSVRIFSVANRKGGVGKTTVTILLATALAKTGKRVLLLDCDNQRSAYDYHRAEQQGYPEEEAPYKIESLEPRFLHDYLKLYREQYDVIFIDMPRMTDDAQDSATVQLLTYCDSILVPVVAGQFDALSTNDFLKTLQSITDFKEKHGIPFRIYGFLNRKNRRKDNQRAVSMMERIGLDMFSHSLGDLKVFTVPSTFDSLMDEAEGQRRFGPFFREFLSKFEL